MANATANLESQIEVATADEAKLVEEIKTFDEAVKSAASLVDPYMSSKRAGMPTDTAKKLDDFKKAAIGFLNASKAFSKKMKDHQGEVTERKEKLSTSLEELKAAPVEDPAELKKEIADLKEQLEALNGTLTSERDEASKFREEMVAKVEEDAEKFAAVEKQLAEANDTIAQQRADLAAANEKADEAEGLAAQQQLASDEASVEAKEAKAAMDTLRAKMEIEAKSRRNEFRAFEAATQSHEKELADWEAKCNDMRRQVEDARAEREAMKSRLADEHLRQHIRVLQQENNQLREEKVSDLHSRANQNSTMAMSGPNEQRIQQLENDKKFLESQQTSLRDQLFQREKETFELTQRLEVEYTKSRGTIEELEQKLFAAQLASNAPLASEQQAAPSNVSPPRSDILKRAVAVQAEDQEKKEQERELIILRSRASDMESDMASAEMRLTEQRGYFEEKLIRQVQDYESMLLETKNSLKVAGFKNQKLMQEIQRLEDERVEQPSVEDTLAEEARLEKWRVTVEKRAVAAEMEAQGLEKRVQLLRHELETQRGIYENKLAKLTEEFGMDSRQTASVMGSTPRDPLPTQPSRGSSVRDVTSFSVASNSNLPSGSRAEPFDPLDVPLRSPIFIDRLRRVDEELMQVHGDSIKIDEKSNAVAIQKEASLQKLAERVKYLYAAEMFWKGEGNTQMGPAGESPQEMLAQTAAELRDLEGKRSQVEAHAVEVFSEIAQERQRLSALHDSLLRKRSDLYKESKSSSDLFAS